MLLVTPLLTLYLCKQPTPTSCGGGIPEQLFRRSVPWVGKKE